jgi:hypothetical protein
MYLLGSEDELGQTMANNAAELHYKLNGSVHSSAVIDRNSVDIHSPSKRSGLGMLPTSDRGSIPDIVEHTQNYINDQSHDKDNSGVKLTAYGTNPSGVKMRDPRDGRRCESGVVSHTSSERCMSPAGHDQNQTRVSEPGTDSSSGLSPTDVSIRETEHLVKGMLQHECFSFKFVAQTIKSS